MSKIETKVVRSENFKTVMVNSMRHSVTPDIIRLIFGNLRAGYPLRNDKNEIVWEDVLEVELTFDYSAFQQFRKDIDDLNKWIENERKKRAGKKKK